MNRKYKWKQLTDDGLIKEPDEVGGSFCSMESLNNWEGFDSEQDAVNNLSWLKARHLHSCFPSTLILIVEYKDQ